MSNNKAVVPAGLQQPTISSLTPGAGNPRDAAMMSGQNMNTKQANLINAVGGRRRRRSLKGGQTTTNQNPSTVVVPQMQMGYQAQNGTSNPNTQIVGLSSTGMQGASNKVYDNQATKMGGSRKRRSRKGGNPDWMWGCYSGGKRRTKRSKSRKYNKKTRKNHRRR